MNKRPAMSRRARRLLWTLGLSLSQAEAFFVAPRTRTGSIPSQHTSMLNVGRPVVPAVSMVASVRPNSAQSKKNIVTLGRRGYTDEALALYKSMERPTVRQMNSAIDACARARPTRVHEAFALLQEGISRKQLKPNVFTFGALMSACSRARDADRAIRVLRSMQVRLFPGARFVIQHASPRHGSPHTIHCSS